MSILIKDIEMPTGCSALTLTVWPDGQVEIIDADGEWKTSEAVPVPPHGRLIDASVAYDKIAEQEGGNYVDMDAVGMGLDETPTVIPAEESDMDSFIRIFEEDDEEDGMDSFIRILKD